MSTDIDPRWLELNDKFSLLRENVCKAVNEQDRRVAVTTFLVQAEEELLTELPSDEYHVFVEVAYLLATRRRDKEIWNWLWKISAAAKPRRKQMLKESLLELIPERPVHAGDLANLWRMWEDRRTRWAVLCAYEPRPKQLLRDLKKISNAFRRDGIRVPVVKMVTFNKWVDKVTSPRLKVRSGRGQ